MKMNIIKEGRKPQKHILRFQCNFCRCIFKANETEYEIATDVFFKTKIAYARCPKCGKLFGAYLSDTIIGGE